MKKIFITILSSILFISILDAELNLNSETAVVLEPSTKKVLYDKDMNKQMSPASMTKIMTMLLIMESIEDNTISLNDEVTISKNASSMGGSQIYLEEGTTLPVETLLTSIAVGSANDAAVAMAEKIGGTVDNFVDKMNKRAKELGATSTTFKNPHGLDEEGHLTTAYDMALIAAELVKHKNILSLTSLYETTITHPNGKSLWLVNTNSLLKFYKDLDGLKTGYTEKAGYCLTATLERNNMRLISVVMNSPTKENRSTDTINLIEYTYSNYSKKVILNNNISLGKLFIDNSTKRYIDYYLEEDVSLILNKDTKEINYKYDIDLYNLKAPLKKNTKVGKLKLYYNDNIIEYNLIIKEDIKKSNFFKRLTNYLKDILSGTISLY